MAAPSCAAMHNTARVALGGCVWCVEIPGLAADLAKRYPQIPACKSTTRFVAESTLPQQDAACLRCGDFGNCSKLSTCSVCCASLLPPAGGPTWCCHYWSPQGRGSLLQMSS